MKYFPALLIIWSQYALSINQICKHPYTKNINANQISECPSLNQFVKDNQNSEIYLVLADPFLKNPASLFGHNFLLFTNNSPKDTISGFTLNFEAVDDSKGALEYFYKGVFGKFKGKYNLKKFYNNIKLYNNFEDRDLSIYHLNYSKEERLMLLFKAWEYGTNSPEIQYYFFNGNCAFYIKDFLMSYSPSTEKPFFYYSPQNVLLDLQDKIFQAPYKIPSSKKEIQLYSKKPDALSKLYADSKYQIYKASRGIKSKKLKKSLEKLNKYKIKSKSNLSPLSLIKRNNKTPYGKIEVGSTSQSQFLINGSIVQNTYFSETGYNELELLSFKTNNFDDRESEFILAKMQSNLIFENKFKDPSWGLSIQHQTKKSLDFVSTNILTNVGLTFKTLQSTFFTISANVILDSEFSDLYPELSVMNLYKYIKFDLSLSQKYRMQFLKVKASTNIFKNYSLSLNLEDFKDHESRTFMALEFRL